MRPATVFLARFIGVFAVLQAGWMILRRDEATGLIHSLLQDRTLGFTWGVFTMAAGLAVVIGHNVWRGGLLPVVVTLMGWALLLKGLALEVLPTEVWERWLTALQFEADYDLYLGVPLVIGLYLLFAGFLHRAAKA